MKVVSMKQPWADFVCAGKKSIEIRTWKTKHRGSILIHTGNKVDKKASLYYNIEPEETYTGGIIGVATLQDVIETEDLEKVWDHIRDATMETGDYEVGMVGWVFFDPKTFEEPIPYKGQLGVFDYDER